ncbi:hypothetical protein MBANPS3_006832 [Mucor bainieri]
MTDIIHRTLPLEIWIRVFQHLSPTNLCQCRLVCQTWNQPAEAAMFTSGILSLASENSAKKLIQLFVEKPYLARFIKNIGFHYPSMISDDTVVKLIKASFTSTMEDMPLSTFSSSESTPTNTSFKLKRLPKPLDPYEEDNTLKIRAAILFGLSLEELRLPLYCETAHLVVNRLESFTRLTRLELCTPHLLEVQQLDAVLKHCPDSLCKLELIFSEVVDHHIDPVLHDSVPHGPVPQDEASIRRWAVQNVKQVNTLKRVYISEPHWDLIYYLAYKYPNVEAFTCGGMGHYNEELALGILSAAVSHLPTFRTKFLYEGHQKLLHSISSICALDDMPQNISASFKYNDNATSMAVETSKRQLLRTLHLDIALHFPSPNASPRILFARPNFRLPNPATSVDTDAVTADIFEYLRTALNEKYTVDKLNVDVISTREWYKPKNDDPPLTFYYIVNNFPDLKHLELSTQAIQHQDLIFNTQLETLKIQFAQVDTQVLPQISKQLPHLYLLDVSNCFLLNDYPQDPIAKHVHVLPIHISMPHSSLAILRVAVKQTASLFTEDIYYEKMRVRGGRFGACYLQLTILDVDMTVYCRLQEHKTIVQLSQAQFEARPDKWNTVAIIATCGSIARVHLEMGDRLRPQINVQEFVLRKLQSQINTLRTEAASASAQETADAITKELNDKQEKYSNYLAKTKYFKEKLLDIPEPYSMYRETEHCTIIKDIPANDSR